MTNGHPTRLDEELVAAVVSAAASSPAIVGGTLAASALALGDGLWAVAASWSAGALLRRERGVAPVVAQGLVLAIVFALMDSAPFEPRRLPWTPALAAYAATAFFVGWAPPRFPVRDGLIALGAAGAIAAFAVSQGAPRPLDQAVCGVGGLAVTWLARLGRRTPAVAAAGVLVAARCALGSEAPLHVLAAASLAGAGAVLAGEFAAALDEDVAADDGARLVILCRSTPWPTSFLVAAAAAWPAAKVVEALCPYDARVQVFAMWIRHESATSIPVVPMSLVVAAGAGFLLHAGRGGRSTWDRLAPWCAAGVTAFGVAAWLVADRRVGAADGASALGLCGCLLLWPLAAGVLLSDVSTPSLVGALASASAAGVALLPWIAERVAPIDAWRTAAFATLIVAPPAFHAAVRARVGAPVILAAAAAAALVQGSIAPDVLVDDRFLFARRDGVWPACVGAWLLAGVLVLAARRCRSMTAVPRDHPIVADCGGQ
jgi:hypothetical protein